jgi:hypothetical protein
MTVKYNLYVVTIGFEFRQSGRVKGLEYSRMRLKARIGKERQGKERQGKERQGKARQGKGRIGKDIL